MNPQTQHFEHYLKSRSEEYPDLTLEGLVNMYTATWPGRIHGLLLELTRHVDLPTHLADPQPPPRETRRGFFQEP